jgi:hypothetical protein
MSICEYSCFDLPHELAASFALRLAGDPKTERSSNMATSPIHAVVSAVNTAKLDSLKSLFSPDLTSSVNAALQNIGTSVNNVQYTVNQTVPEGNYLAFTYTATGSSDATGKAGSWTGSGVATLEGQTIVSLQVHEDQIAKAIALGGGVKALAAPSATGTWVGSASGFTVTLKLVQSGTAITGTVAISGFSDTYPVTGSNNYPHTPNLVVNASVMGLATEFDGNFNGATQVAGTLTITGFPAIDVTINKSA